LALIVSVIKATLIVSTQPATSKKKKMIVNISTSPILIEFGDFLGLVNLGFIKIWDFNFLF
jgi:hypothetical protein